VVFDLSQAINLGILLAGVVAAAIYIKSSIQKQRHDELENLAATRGNTIQDLRSEMEDLRREVAELRGQYNALQALKVDQIANAVIAKLVGDDTLKDL
jgi:ribosomal protein L29